MCQKKRFHKPPYIANDLGKTLQGLANMRCQKKGPPYVKVGESVLYPVDLYEAYLRKRLVKTLDAAHAEFTEGVADAEDEADASDLKQAGHRRRKGKTHRAHSSL